VDERNEYMIQFISLFCWFLLFKPYQLSQWACSEFWRIYFKWQHCWYIQVYQRSYDL